MEGGHLATSFHLSLDPIQMSNRDPNAGSIMWNNRGA